jgi:hypothetical protein
MQIFAKTTQSGLAASSNHPVRTENKGLSPSEGLKLSLANFRQPKHSS